MKTIENYMERYPGGDDDSSSLKDTSADLVNESEGVEEKKETLQEEIHNALQDWSNKDQADQDFDDTQP